MLAAVVIGGWGHWREPLDELGDAELVTIEGIAPGYAGEDVSGPLSHPFLVGVRRYGDYLEMLREVKPELAIVGTRLDLIAEVGMAAASRRCHLICEKPLGLSRERLGVFRQAVADAGVRLMPMHSMRNLPAFLAAKEAYATGRIGEAVIVNVRKSYKWGVRPAWFGDRAVYGGTIPWIGVHALDMIHMITRDHAARISAVHGNATRPDFPECEDFALMMGELTGGGRFTASIDFLRPHAAPTHGDDWIRLVGTSGVIEANGSSGWAKLASAEGEPADLPLPPPGAIFRQFVESLTGFAESPLAVDDAFRLSDAALVARASADHGGEWIQCLCGSFP